MNAVVVIGSGLVGLSAACYLTSRGYDVTVIEREELPGGRAGVLRRDGFTFDTGPTVLTMPDLIADAVRAASRDPSANLYGLLPMRRLDPAYRPCFADGSTNNVRHGREVREEIAQTCGGVDAAAFVVGRLAAPALPGGDAELHRPELRLPARSAVFAPSACPAATAGRLRPARRGGAEAVRRPAPASAVQFSGDVRRAVAGIRSGPLCRNHLYGHDRGGLVS